MGKGDRKTRRGKICKGSFGNTRPHKQKKSVSVASKTISKSANKPKKAVSKLAKRKTTKEEKKKT